MSSNPNQFIQPTTLMLSKQTKHFHRHAQQIPINTYSLPDFLLCSSVGRHLESITEYNIIELDYSQGYPIVVATGEPIWEPDAIPDEPGEYLSLLTKYIQMPYSNILTNIEDQTFQAYAYMRSLKHLVDNHNDLQLLYHHATLHHWSTRAKAYDMFRLGADVRRRQQLRRNQEIEQYNRNTNLVDKATALINQMLDDPLLYEVKPADAIRLYNVVSKSQRTAIGLPENGPLKNNQDQYQDDKELLEMIAPDKHQTNNDNNLLTADTLTDQELLEQIQLAMVGK